MAADKKHTNLQDSIASFMDIHMFFALLVLCGLGITMMTSTTVEIGYKGHEDAFFYVKKQTVFLLLGALCIFALTKIRLAYWEQLGPLLLIVTIALLVMC